MVEMVAVVDNWKCPYTKINDVTTIGNVKSTNVSMGIAMVYLKKNLKEIGVNHSTKAKQMLKPQN